MPRAYVGLCLPALLREVETPTICMANATVSLPDTGGGLAFGKPMERSANGLGSASLAHTAATQGQLGPWPPPSVPSSGRAVVADLSSKEPNQDLSPPPPLEGWQGGQATCKCMLGGHGFCGQQDSRCSSPGLPCLHTHGGLGDAVAPDPAGLIQPWQSQVNGQGVKPLCFSLCPQKPTVPPGNKPDW